MEGLTQKKLGERVKKFRTELGVSQEDVAECLGITRQAVGQIEKGERKLDSIELIKLADYFHIPVQTFLKPESSEVKKRMKIKCSEDIEFSQEKLRNLLLYLLEKCGGKPNIGETVLYKLLYFIDFDAYELQGKPITGIQYINLQYGPVPQKEPYGKTIEKMLKDKELEIFSHQYYGKPQKRYIALTDPDISVFSAEELDIIDKAINRLSDMNATQIADFVHGDMPWRMTKDHDAIRYDLAFERKLPYAKRNYEELWETAAGSDILKELGPISEEELDYYENLEES